MGDRIIINNGEISGGYFQNSEGFTKKKKESPSYDIAVSYASEQEEYVKKVVKILEAEKIKVFFAPNRMNEFKAKDMYTQFYKIFRYQCKYVACFISEEYKKKEYTMHEFRTALLHSRKEKRNCIIPIYFGCRDIEGLDSAISYLEADQLCELEIAVQILEILEMEEM